MVNLREQFERNLNEKPRKKSGRILRLISGILAIGLITGYLYTAPKEYGRAAAGINKAINFQGKLMNSSSVTVADGDQSIIFRIYDASTGGSCLYTARGTCASATAKTITVTNGIFSTLLGESGDNDLSTVDFNSDSLFLGIKVSSDSEMTPRVRVGSTAYAFNTDTLDGLDSTSFLRADTTDTSFGLVTFNATPTGTAVNTGSLYINATTTTANLTLFGAAANGSERFRVDMEGDVFASSTIYAGAINTATTTATSTFSGAIAAIGNIRLGNASSDLIDVTGQFTTSLLPAVNNVVDFGAFSNVWRDVYASGTIYGANVFASGNINASGTSYLSHTVPARNNGYDFGSATSSWRDVYASGTLYLGSDIIPNTNNFSYLGGVRNSWLDIFASGTIYAGGGNANNSAAINLSQSPTAKLDFGQHSRALPDTNENGWAIRLFGSGTYDYDGDAGIGVNTSEMWFNAGGTVNTFGFYTNGERKFRVGTNAGFNVDVVADSNNSWDLGTFGSAWNDVFASGTLYGAKLFVSGNINASSTTYLAHTVPSINNAFDFGSATSSWRDLYASGTSRFGGNLTPNINNTIDLGAYGNVWRDLYASSTFRIGSATTSVSLDGRDLIFSGTSSIRSTPTDVASNAAFVFNTLNSPSNADLLRLQTNGTTQFSVGAAGLVSASGTLQIRGSGSSTFTNGLVAGTLGITGSGTSTSISGGLFASSINASTYLTVAGTSGTTTVLARALTTGLHSTGGITADNVLLVGGTASSSFAGALEVLGNTRLGNATTDLIDITGRITTSVLPSVNNNVDFGGSNNAWRSIYASGTSYLGHTIPGGNNLYDLGSGTSSWRNIYASGTSYMAGILSPTNNGSDLGAYGNAWNDVYASGTIVISDTSSSGVGVIYKGANRFIHNYKDSTANGNNIFIGVAGNFTMSPSGGAATLSSYNVGVGDDSLISLTTGRDNVALGFETLKNTNSGTQNVAIGSSALRANTTAGNSIAIGYAALVQGTTGGSNLAIGSNALYGLTTSTLNVAIGDNAMSAASFSGTTNVAIGPSALQTIISGSANTAVGYQALSSNTRGIENSAFGNQAMVTNITGDYNAAFGARALDGNTTGLRNTGIGANAGYRQKVGADNVFLGAYAGDGNTDNWSATSTTAVGAYSLYNIDSNADNNTALGYRSGYVLTTGANNIILGYQAGDNLTTGANNIILGYDIDAPTATSAQTLTIGNLLFGTGLDGSGTTLSTGNIGVGTSTPYAKFSIDGNEDKIQMAVRGHSTQTANLQEWQSDTTILGWMNSLGGLGASGTSYIAGILSPTNNGSDLGAFGNAWRDLYASSTLRIGSATTSVSLDGRDLIFSGTSSIRSTPTDVASNAAFVFNTLNSPSNADLLRLQTNGTTQFSVGAAGLVSASGTLQIRGSGSSTFTNGLVAGTLGITGSGTSTSIGGGLFASSINASTYLTVAGTSGTTTVLARALTTGLHSTGGITADNVLLVGGTGTSTFAGGVAVDTSDFVVIPGTGRVGIGTANPKVLLDVNGFVAINSSSVDTTSVDLTVGGMFEFDASGGVAYFQAYSRSLGDYVPARWDATSHSFRTGVTQVLDITSGALVGIGTSTPSQKLTVSGGMNVTGNFYASGTSYLAHTVPSKNNAFDFGSATSSWRDLYASGTSRFGGNLTPNINNTLDLGGSNNAWRSIFASGTSYLGHTVPGGNNLYDLGSATSSWRDLYASGTSRFGGNLTPNINNTIDLGAYGNVWKDIYASSSLNVSSGAASTTISSSGNILTTGHLSAGSIRSNYYGDTGGTTRFNFSDTGIIKVPSGQNLLPESNNSQDLGGSNNAWRSIFASGTSYLGHTVPGGNNLYDLGSATSSWRDLYASGTSRFGGNLTPNINNTLDLGGSNNAWRSIYASGTSYLGHTIPGGNNLYDLGSPTSSWGNIYASGTLTVGTSGGTTTSTFLNGAGFAVNGGNVGIGTSTPRTKLDVAGNFAVRRANGTLFLRADSIVASPLFTINSDSGIRFQIYPDAPQVDFFGVDVAIRDGGSNINTNLASTGGASYFNNTGGNVGVGTSTPSQKLTVSGGMYVSDNLYASGTSYLAHTVPSINNAFDLGSATSSWANIYASGTLTIGNPDVTATSTFRHSLQVNGSVNIGGECDDAGGTNSCADVAEVYPSSEPVAPGELVMLETNGQVPTVKKTSSAYTETLIGVVSSRPGAVLGDSGIQLGYGGGNPMSPAIALTGRVPVKISTENGEINPGDFLTSSSIPGVAMKATRAGTVIGRALEGYSDNSVGKILVYVNTSWFGGVVDASSEVGSLTPMNQASETSLSGVVTLSELSMEGDINMNGHLITNIGGLIALGNSWKVDENGNFVTKGTYVTEVETGVEKTKQFYAISSPDVEFHISGSGQLTDGEAMINFEEETSATISAEIPLKVSVTLTDQANGVYVTEKSVSGFKVKELADGKSNATFDWVVIARRKGFEQFVGIPLTPTSTFTPDSRFQIPDSNNIDGGGGNPIVNIDGGGGGTEIDGGANTANSQQQTVSNEQITVDNETISESASSTDSGTLAASIDGESSATSTP